MDRELERLQREAHQTITDANEQLKRPAGKIENHLTRVRDEYHRVVELSGQAAKTIDQIDVDFKAKSKLASSDIILLFLATAIQCARQYLFSNDKFRLTARQGDGLVEGTIGELLPPTVEEILFQSVPYDAIKTGEYVRMTGLSGTTHRYRTLGHDPLLGWIFGTANIMTNSLTKHNFETFQVSGMKMIRHYPMGAFGMLQKAADYAQRDPLLLAAAVGRQAVHFGSDYFTKQGLPIPLLATANNDLAAKMLRSWHIDMWSVTRGAALAALINQLVRFIHQLFYNEQKDGSVSLYEIRTRKILSYSNLLATGSNVIVTAFTRDMTKFDLGGILVTLTRIVSDYKFIHEIKKDFLKNEFYNRIVGSEYDFMGGN